jgi:hypothetical protein
MNWRLKIILQQEGVLKDLLTAEGTCVSPGNNVRIVVPKGSDLVKIIGILLE